MKSEDRLEEGLLLGGDGEEDSVIYTASFEEEEEKFVNYSTAWWVLYSLLLLLALGIGILMLLYLPVRRYILRQDLRSRELYVTRNAIVYKVRRPVWFPCFFLKKEKHVLLPSVANVVIEQGLVQSKFGVYSIRIENVGVRRPPSDDVQIEGVNDPHEFQKAVLNCLSDFRDEVFVQHVSGAEDVGIVTPRIGATMSTSRSGGLDRSGQVSEIGVGGVLQKLDEVSRSVKKIERWIEDRNPAAPR